MNLTRGHEIEGGGFKTVVALLVGAWGAMAEGEDTISKCSVTVHRCDEQEMAPVMANVFNAEWIVAGIGIDDTDLQQTVAAVRAVQPSVRVAVLGDPSDWRRCETWLRKGCHIYLNAESPIERVASTIQHSSAHDVAIADRAFQRLQEMRRAMGVPELTRREREVLELLHRGLRNREIARVLYITENTVEYHMKHILQKLGARSRLEAVERSTALGIS